MVSPIHQLSSSTAEHSNKPKYKQEAARLPSPSNAQGILVILKFDLFLVAQEPFQPNKTFL